MLFNSLEFVLFFLIVYLLYRLLDHKSQNMMLLLASYIFYSSWDYRFLSLILTSTIVDYICGNQIFISTEKRRKKIFLLASLICNLGLLAVFKYFNFFIDSAEMLLSTVGFTGNITTLNIILPVGISFYTFQTLSYTIDIYRGTLKPERNIINFALFVAYFPQLVAGPIERASRLLPQISSPRIINSKNVKEGLFCIFWGYFLKLFLADNLAIIADQIFSTDGIIPGSEALMGGYAFAFQIFGDFAGYSFIAIGVSKLLGIHLMTNFLYPYFVTTPSQFWQNWHISLSSWLKDYLYIPLGGNKNGLGNTYRNLFLTMLLGGLWHGAAWTFVVWGAYQGGILILFRYFESITKPDFLKGKYWNNKLVEFGKIILMFHLTCIGWLIFRADNIVQLKNLLHSIFFNLFEPSKVIVYYSLYLFLHIWLVILVQVIQKKNNDLYLFNVMQYKHYMPVYLTMFYLLVLWGEAGGVQFIYFQF